MTYFTGLDLHKRSVTATTLDVDGAVVATAKMPCVPLALKAYFAQTPGEHIATVECTAGWDWVKDALTDRTDGGPDVDLRLAHTTGVKAIASGSVEFDRPRKGLWPVSASRTSAVPIYKRGASRSKG